MILHRATDKGQNSTSPFLPPTSIGVRPASERNAEFHSAYIPTTFLASDSFVRYAGAITVNSDSDSDTVSPAEGEGESLDASVVFVGTQCCFHGSFDESVTAYIKAGDAKEVLKKSVKPANGSVCVEEAYGAHTVRISEGVRSLANVSTQALVRHMQIGLKRGIVLNNTLTSLVAHPDPAILEDSGSLTFHESNNTFHLDAASSIRLKLPVKTSLVWITGATGPGFGELQVSMSPNISWWFGPKIPLESTHTSAPDGTLFMAPIRVGSGREVTLSAGSARVSLSNVLIYTEELMYTEKESDGGLVRTINILGGAAWGVAGIVVVILLTSLVMQYRSKKQKRWLDDQFSMFDKEDDYYEAPAVPISPYPPNEKSPVVKTRKVSLDSTTSSESEYSSEQHAYGRGPGKPLRVVIADNIIRTPSSPMPATPDSATTPLAPYRKSVPPLDFSSPFASPADVMMPLIYAPPWREDSQSQSQPPTPTPTAHTPRSPFPPNVPRSPAPASPAPRSPVNKRLSMRNHRSPWCPTASMSASASISSSEASRPPAGHRRERSEIITVHMAM